MENDDLTCIVCFEIFNEPVCIPCGHTFCRVCIEETIKRTQKCPLCACPYFNNLHFKTNITLKKIIEKLKEKEKKDTTELKEEKTEKNKKEKTVLKEEKTEKEVKKEEEKNYEQLLAFQQTKISPFFKNTLYKIKIENHYNPPLFKELSKNSLFLTYYTTSDKTATKFHLRQILSFTNKEITLIADCLEKVEIKSLEQQSFKNNPYFLQHNLLLEDEELLLTKIDYENFPKIQNEVEIAFLEKLKVIDKKAAFFYNKLKLYNRIEYGILGKRHKVFILGGGFSLDYKRNLEDYMEFLCSVLNFSEERKLVLWRTRDVRFRINVVYDFLKDLSLDHNAVFIFFIRDKLENHNNVLVYVFLMLVVFVFYKYFLENKNGYYYYD